MPGYHRVLLTQPVRKLSISIFFSCIRFSVAFRLTEKSS